MTDMNVRNIRLSLHLFNRIFLGEGEFEVLLKVPSCGFTGILVLKNF